MTELNMNINTTAHIRIRDPDGNIKTETYVHPDGTEETINEVTHGNDN